MSQLDLSTTCVDDVRRFVEALRGDDHDAVHELRIPHPKRHGPKRLCAKSYAGWFDESAALAKAATALGPLDAEAIYVTLNPTNPALLARADNHLDAAKSTTADRDIICLRHFLIDVDPVRPSGISATDAERDAALATRDAIADYLSEELGWPTPLLTSMSGNGGSLIYRLPDLPNDVEHVELLRHSLAALGQRFTTKHVSVDQTVFNPSRITKVVGTVAAKGEHLRDRPWRRATAQFHADPQPVRLDALRVLAALAEPRLDRADATSRGRVLSYDPVPDNRERVRMGLTAIDAAFQEHDAGYATVFRLERCLSCGEPESGAAVLIFPSGALAYRCHRNRCAGKGWRDLPDDLRRRLGFRPLGDDAIDPRSTLVRSQNDGLTAKGVQLRAMAELIVVGMDTVQPKAVDWLWQDWLARGKLHILGGHPGDGKSTLTAAIAAATSLSSGRLPDGSPAPLVRTLFLLAEDALDDTLAPRLDAHGADRSQIFAIQAVRDEQGQDRLFNLQKHLSLLEEAILTRDISLVVIDPVTSFMAGGDRNAEGDVRDALTPLGKLAERCNVAVIGIMHVGKPTGGNRRPVQQLLGSTAFGAIARIVWMVAPAPDDPDGERRVLGVVKSNLARRPAPLEWSRSDDGPIVWHGASSHHMDELFGSGGRSSRADAEAFLRDELIGGSKPAATLLAAAKDLGISEKTLRRASEALGVEKFRTRVTGPWFWRLPDGSAQPPDGQPSDGHVATWPTEDGEAGPGTLAGLVEEAALPDGQRSSEGWPSGIWGEVGEL